MLPVNYKTNLKAKYGTLAELTHFYKIKVIFKQLNVVELGQLRGGFYK